jgi:glucose-6-phosphate 1-dehydrogenase
MTGFGHSGNLFAHKLAKALFVLFGRGGILPEDFKIVAFARRNFSDTDFRAQTKENIFKRGEVDLQKLDKFLLCLDYFQGDFAKKEDFVKLGAILAQEKNRQIIFHVASAPDLYEKIFENMSSAGFSKMFPNSRILIEKPFGKNGSEAIQLEKILSSIFHEEQIFHIDHYLAKETARKIFDFRFLDGTLQNIWNNESIKKIKVSFHESHTVGARGASYDAVGDFRDVGENHMLQLLTLVLMNKPEQFSPAFIREARAKLIQDLSLDSKQKITKGQYEGYLSEPGVKANSETETFFRVFLESRDPKFFGVEIELEGGKGLVDLHSEITTTTVSVKVYFKDGSEKEFKIQPVPSTVYDSYTKVYEDAIKGDQTLFVSIEEIFAEWKIADELLEKWKDIPVKIYKVGSKPGYIM